MDKSSCGHSRFFEELLALQKVFLDIFKDYHERIVKMIIDAQSSNSHSDMNVFKI